MSKPAVEIKDLSKAYMIGHEREAMAGTMTFRDSLVNIARKPYELFTGHQLKKEKFWALKDVNLEIEQGDVVGIIGRNGSGKSTLLKVLSRIVEPTKGEVIMRGRVASLLEVGTGFHPELTGRENVYFNGAILGMTRKEIQSKFDEIVAFSEVEKFLDTPVKFYSSGMYVRLAFAVAAHLDPDILIVDEVLAVGDAAFQKKCLGKMKDVAGQGRTVLFVSHNMAAVRSLCSLGVYMNEGKLVYSGGIDKALASYQKAINSVINRSLPKEKTHIKTLVSNVAQNSADGIVEITAKLNIAPEDLGADLVVGFGIEDGLHNRVATFVSEWQSVKITPQKDEIEVVCILPDLPLVSGNYFVSSSLSRNEITVDYIDNGSMFSFSSSKSVATQRTVEHGPIEAANIWETRDV